MNSILESSGYNELRVEELYSKLKTIEVDQQLRATLTGAGSKSLALSTTSSESGANPPGYSISFSALMYLTEEQLATFGDEELCLVFSRFQRAYDNRMNKKRGEKPCIGSGGITNYRRFPTLSRRPCALLPEFTSTGSMGTALHHITGIIGLGKSLPALISRSRVRQLLVLLLLPLI